MAVMADPADVFAQNVPSFEFPEAEKAVMDGRMIQSFTAQPLIGGGGKIIALGIKWKLANSTETVILGPYAALALRMMLSHLEENKWTELATLLPDATRQ
jgi:hypothetical protein